MTSAISMMPALDALQLVAGAGEHQQQEEVGHVGAPRSRDWPTPTVSTSTMSKPAASQSSMVSRVRRRDAAEVPARRRRADERALLDGEPLHARLVAEDAAARHGARRVDAEHRDALAAVAHEVHAERVDERALADARHAGDADARATGRCAAARASSDLAGQVRRRRRRSLSTSVMRARRASPRSPRQRCPST